MSSPSIAKGTCYALFAFEVGQSVDLVACERLIPAMGRQSLRHPRRAPAYFHYRPAPLRLVQEADPVNLGSITTRNQIEIVLYDFGAIIVIFSIPLEGPLESLIGLSNILTGNETLLTAARSRATSLVEQIAEAVVRPHVASVVEDYNIYHVESFEAPVNVAQLPRDHAQLLTQILRSERQTLSTQEVTDALSANLSFAENDLTLVDWNAALVIDPESDETRAVLEFANAQLLEMRFLDEQLDHALEQSYQTLATTGWRRRRGLRSYAADLERLSTLQADGVVLFERVTNALKLVGDMFLSRLYRTVSQRFRLAEWDAGITRKLQTIEGIYQKLTDRASARRLEALEWIVIILIALEIVLTLVHW
jgi:hypothetical protein